MTEYVLLIKGPRAIGACGAIAKDIGAFKMPHPTKAEARVVLQAVDMQGAQLAARRVCDSLRQDLDDVVRDYPELAAPPVQSPEFSWNVRSQIRDEL